MKTPFWGYHTLGKQRFIFGIQVSDVMFGRREWYWDFLFKNLFCKLIGTLNFWCEVPSSGPKLTWWNILTKGAVGSDWKKSEK